MFLLLNGNKYGYIKESPKYIKTLFGMNVETENMPRDYDFLIQWRPEKPQTNGDRIRQMSDEELAEFLDNIDGDFPPNVEQCTIEESERYWLEYLKEEAEK